MADRSGLLAALVVVAALASGLAGCSALDPAPGGHRYACASLLTSEPSQDGLPGFATEIDGRNHVRDPNTVIRYASCPPTSGDHFNIANRGPIRPGLYPAGEEQVPGGWLHNMEHGYVVALYRCPSGVIGDDDCISETEVEQLQTFYEEAPVSSNPSCPTKLVIARFDSMTTRFAVIAWGRALLTDDFVPDEALQFAEQWQDSAAAPEAGLC